MKIMRLLSFGLFSILTLSAFVSCDESVFDDLFAETYVVTFNSQGGSAVDHQEVVVNGLAIQPADPDYIGRTFAGWFREAACINPWMFASDMVQADTTLYARWTINQFTLAYAAGANGSLTGTTMQTVDYGTDGTMVTAVPDTGYSFVEWNPGGSTVNPRTDTNVTGNINVTASFAINQRQVIYNGNGFSGGTGPAGNPFTCAYGDTVTVLDNNTYDTTTWWRGPQIVPGITQRFTGWNTEADGTGTSYAPGSTFTMPDANVRLFAQWTTDASVIRKIGPAGGYVFYDKTYFSDGWQYMEAAPVDLGPMFWGDGTLLTGEESDDIGTGLQHTNAVIATVNPANAAWACVNYNLNGCADWFLPSYGELYQMHQNLYSYGIGNFANTQAYWSSTQQNDIYSSTGQGILHILVFEPGPWTGYWQFQTVSYLVRPARRF